MLTLFIMPFVKNFYVHIWCGLENIYNLYLIIFVLQMCLYNSLIRPWKYLQLMCKHVCLLRFKCFLIVMIRCRTCICSRKRWEIKSFFRKPKNDRLHSYIFILTYLSFIYQICIWSTHIKDTLFHVKMMSFIVIKITTNK